MGTVALAIVAAVGAGLKLGGGILQAKGIADQAEAESQALEFKAQVAEQQATSDAARLRRRNRREVSKARVGFAKAGVRLEGTPLEVLAQNAAELELDAANTEIAGRTFAQQQRRAAKTVFKQGQRAAGAALLGATGEAIGFGASVFGGGGKGGGKK